MRELRYGKFWLASGMVLLAVIMVLALSPTNRTVTVEFLSDKFMHGLTFFVLTVWFCGIFRMRFVPAIAVGLLAYGLLIEFLQSRLPYFKFRSPAPFVHSFEVTPETDHEGVERPLIRNKSLTDESLDGRIVYGPRFLSQEELVPIHIHKPTMIELTDQSLFRPRRS